MTTRKQKIIVSLAATSAALTALPAFAARHTIEPVAAPRNETSGTWSSHRENVLGTSLDMTVKALSAADARRAQQAVHGTRGVSSPAGSAPVASPCQSRPN